MKKEEPFTTTDFRNELKKNMPGFKWTVHKQRISKEFFEATGIQSAGLNRIGTMEVERLRGVYGVKVSGHGTKVPWISTATGRTLMQALRGVQDNCEWHARNFASVATMIKNARKKK